MSPLTATDRARADELLADRATQGLSSDGDAELRSLLAETEAMEAEAFERAAAAVQLAGMKGRVEPMPAHLARLIEAAALAPHAASLASAKSARVAAIPRRSAFGTFAPWALAAVFLGVAVLAWILRPGPRPDLARSFDPRIMLPAPTAVAEDPAAARAALLATTGTVEIAWSTGKDPTGAKASGDVVWNDAEQRGFMRFRGLAANDPKEMQYQLWIFDKNRDDHFPVDGGVFDVDAKSGEVIVPIRSKLSVAKASLFAVTAEKPGGVVVSKRDRVVVTAAVKG